MKTPITDQLPDWVVVNPSTLDGSEFSHKQKHNVRAAVRTILLCAGLAYAGNLAHQHLNVPATQASPQANPQTNNHKISVASGQATDK